MSVDIGSGVDIGSSEDFPDGVLRGVTVEGRMLTVARYHGTLFAVRNECPHQLAPLCAGTLSRRLMPGERFGDISVDPDTPMVTCPWHGWEFSLRDGQSAWGDSGYRIKTFPIDEHDGRVYVNLPRARPRVADTAARET